jgi:hypothetical protein
MRLFFFTFHGILLLFPPWGFWFLDSGFPQWDGFVGGYFLLVPSCYCFNFFLFFWHYSTNGLDFPYSTVQKHEPVEWDRDEQN